MKKIFNVIKGKRWTIIKITIKVLLCVSLIVSFNLLINYVRNLNPTADGFNVGNVVARLIHGDEYWSWEKLTTSLTIACNISIALFCIDGVLGFVRSTKK